MDKNIVISIKTVLFTALLLVGGYLVFELGRILGLIFIALLLTISLEHTVKFFAHLKLFKRNIPRSLAVLFTYLLVFSIVSAALTIGIDPVITQIQKLVQTLSRSPEIVLFGGNIDFSISEIVSGFVATSDGVISATKSIIGNVAAVLSVMVISIYLSIDWENLKKSFTGLFPQKEQNHVTNIMNDIELNVGHWLRGQLILMLVIGLMSYVGLLAVGVEFALALAIIAGLFELIPTMGPILSAVVAGLVAVVDSPIKALLVILVFWAIQALENNLIVPKVMQRVSGFRPLVILISLLVGSHLFGIIGAITAVPVLIFVTTILRQTVFRK